MAVTLIFLYLEGVFGGDELLYEWLEGCWVVEDAAGEAEFDVHGNRSTVF